MRGVSNTETHPVLDERLAALQAELNERYAGHDRASLAKLAVVEAYLAHYKAFGQTYHVVRQLESVVARGRPLTSTGGALVDAMFAAELSTLLLTAGHDVDSLQLPLWLDVSRAGDRFVAINGSDREVRPGDMVMRDEGGIVSAVLYGPDQRTRLSEKTTRAFFVTYAPAGISSADARRHLELISDYARIVEPTAAIEELVIVGASS